MFETDAIYTDKFGETSARLCVDGLTIKLCLRDAKFCGGCFESLNGEKNDHVEQDSENDLTNFTLQFVMPLRFGTAQIPITILVKTGAIHQETGVKLKDENHETIIVSAWHDVFEDALIELQQLRGGHALQSCLSCRLSHYSPYGAPLYGGLRCFKSAKIQNDHVKDKAALLDMWENEDAVFVQETHHCAAFELIKEDDWNYSNWPN